MRFVNSLGRYYGAEWIAQHPRVCMNPPCSNSVTRCTPGIPTTTHAASKSANPPASVTHGILVHTPRLKLTRCRVSGVKHAHDNREPNCPVKTRSQANAGR